MPPRKTADGARAASEAASEGGGPPADASAAANAATANANASSNSSSKPTTTAKGKQAKGKTGKKGKKEAAPEETHRCFHCQSESTKMMCCSQCHRAAAPRATEQIGERAPHCPCRAPHWQILTRRRRLRQYQFPRSAAHRPSAACDA